MFRRTAVIAFPCVLLCASVALSEGDSPFSVQVDKSLGAWGLWVLAPAGVAIGLTILSRQVIPSLFVGVLVGSAMIASCQAPGTPFAGLGRPLAAVRLAVETYIIGAVHETPAENYARIKVLAFTLFVAFTVGVILRNGGTAGMVRIVAGGSRSRRRGGVTAWIAGMVVFFDDYANCMILGPTMRPIFDRLKLSRAKLAYIVNATASPDVSLALLGTWIGALLGFIDSGLLPAIQHGSASFLLDASGTPMTAMQAFLGSLPYRFFPVLTLVAALLFVLLDRDFGPMRGAQDRAASQRDPENPSRETPSRCKGEGRVRVDETASESRDPSNHECVSPRPTWWLGFFPILTLVIVTLIVLAATGMTPSDQIASAGWFERVSAVLKNADSYLSILYGSLAAAVAALLLNAIARTCTFREAMDAGLSSMSHTVPALTILVLAWALSKIETDLQIGPILTQRLEAMQFPPIWVPFSISVVAFLLSFATGTSWGTMAILCPITIPLAARLASTLPPDQALIVFHASVGSTLGGALFGDHCSPISATTVLASVGADCPQFEHVWTQMPYALMVGAISLLCGDLLCVVMGQAWYVGMSVAVAMVLGTILVFGRSADSSQEFVEAESP